MNYKIPVIGEHVAWKWGSGVAEGEVIEVCSEKTQIVSKDSVITRNGTPENPAVIIKHSRSGNQVIKLASELLNQNE